MSLEILFSRSQQHSQNQVSVAELQTRSLVLLSAVSVYLRHFTSVKLLSNDNTLERFFYWTSVCNRQSDECSEAVYSL